MIVWNSACRSARLSTRPLTVRRCLSQRTLDRLTDPVQSYISTSRDPYLNLSIEHFLLQQSAPESVVLLLYVNRPSIIIGRNQNPWLEVNLALLDPSSHDQSYSEPPGLGAVDLVRRRSGGGTVFHDEGNVNWTVICPSKDFTRDQHAEMVVRALRDCGIDRARVNVRHDIVLDQGQHSLTIGSDDTHSTPYQTPEADARKPLKVSGSAYKLTRQRALHHGTCLLSSPNLNIIPHYLHSPAKPYMTARGVESVSSPVGNILLSNERFIASVQKQFGKLYRSIGDAQEVGDEWQEHDSVRKGCDELKSPEWTYLQTPQFSISNQSDTLTDVDLELSVRNGVISSGFCGTRKSGYSGAARTGLPAGLDGRRLHDISSWDDELGGSLPSVSHDRVTRLCKWLHMMLPPPIGRPNTHFR
ncbi:hypothetical protein LTR08_006801 [Meristemomyces frigidus]|nr:hypothetical protein LTR08_006801 [Meristemomyces frigidus]